MFDKIIPYEENLFFLVNGMYTNFLDNVMCLFSGFKIWILPAIFTALLFRNRLYDIVIFTWAITISYSLVYLGVHFVSDIIGGMIAGILMGFIVFEIYRRWSLIIQKKTGTQSYAVYPDTQIKRLSITILIYILFPSLLSKYLILL